MKISNTLISNRASMLVMNSRSSFSNVSWLKLRPVAAPTINPIKKAAANADWIPKREINCLRSYPRFFTSGRVKTLRLLFLNVNTKPFIVSPSPSYEGLYHFIRITMKKQDQGSALCMEGRIVVTLEFDRILVVAVIRFIIAVEEHLGLINAAVQ